MMLETWKSIRGSGPGKQIGSGDSDGNDNFMSTNTTATVVKACTLHANQSFQTGKT